MTLFLTAVTIAWLYAAANIARRVDAGRPSGGTWIAAAAVIVAVYLWRFAIGKSGASRRGKSVLFVALLLALTPYIYGFAGLIADWARLPISKWVGDFVWVYAVPVASFAFFDLREQPASLKTYVLRSGVEMFVAVPLWTVVWIIAQSAFGWWYT
ncbi:hypothetical protein Fuma_02340 [Fuerstiella marisgermanici]|uniref:Uncharacterized protein n=2 Tax=Fuerstiella marisgermanici TaxID=1891926 RepID=A0A1P8WF71_9PLAN|nr:hypothetical protein Fuma_02340 [Fuerstiella marisgermanici]